MSNLRVKSVLEATGRKAVKVELPKERVERYYGKQVFNRQKMFEYLPRETYMALIDAIDNRKPLSRELADSGVRVIVAGLDMDYTGKPFGPMPALMATAEYVTKVHAICVRCGNLAHHSHRLTQDEKLVVLGETDSYEAICRHCFKELVRDKKEK